MTERHDIRTNERQRPIHQQITALAIAPKIDRSRDKAEWDRLFREGQVPTASWLDRNRRRRGMA